jgi:catechol 2,3-dioxygenase-like lactoylglutathione lyase family enzyme/extradiol dioxygenase family protein
MAILGIESLIYGVNDIAESERFFDDFGLFKVQSSRDRVLFDLDEGSHVELKIISDPSLPKTVLAGTGVRETVWGVDTIENLEALVSSLEVDREVRRDKDGTAHFLTDCGLAFALRVYKKRGLISCPDPTNSPGNEARVNKSRKWWIRAKPKGIEHIVFAVEDYMKSYRFLEERLGFKLSEYQVEFGIYLRCDGSTDHHNIMLHDFNKGGASGYPVFDHANFIVENIDEMQAGANYMTRKGWSYGPLGIGRHRIASALYCYLKSPAGGEVEYGCDSDRIDDHYVPREWDMLFGLQSWMSFPPDFVRSHDAEPYSKQLANGIPAHIRSTADLPEGVKLA